MPRSPRQPAFSDVVIDDEDLEEQLRIILRNQPTAKELTAGKARRAATKKAKTILVERHKDKLYRATDEAQWVRVGEVGLIEPLLRHYPETTVEAFVAHEGGEDKVVFDVRPMSFRDEQLALQSAAPPVEEKTMVVDGTEATVRRPKREPAAPSVDEVAFGRVLDEAVSLDEEQRAARERLANRSRLP